MIQHVWENDFKVTIEIRVKARKQTALLETFV